MMPWTKFWMQSAFWLLAIGIIAAIPNFIDVQAIGTDRMETINTSLEEMTDETSGVENR